MSLELTGKQIQGLQRALMAAFPSREGLQQMSLFELDLPLNQVAGQGPLTDIVFQLIVWARAHGKMEELIAGARNANSGNPDLKAFVVEIGLHAERPPRPGGAVERQLQALVVEGPDLTGVLVSDWRKGFGAAELAICSLETAAGKHIGSGFLVASDLVMTNGHVADLLKQAGGRPQARFDYLEKVPAQGGTVVPVATGNWELVNSPPEELDYALLRLASRVGDENAAGATRGWLTPVANHAFVKDEPILIVQHPSGNPLQISVGYLRDLNQHTRRIAYTVNTAGGSSGSPCFSMGWKLIALHHHGGAFTNHGIPMQAIVDDLRQKDFARLFD